MIPQDPEERDILAGEYVLGVLDAEQAAEIAAGLASDAALGRAVQFWEEQLHPLSALAEAAEPPEDGWERIARRIARVTAPPSARSWNPVVLWRSTAFAAAALAAALLLYIAVTPRPAAPPDLIALLHDPANPTPAWIATEGPGGLSLRKLGEPPAPSEKDLQLWAIAPGAKAPRSLGLIAADGRLLLGSPPAEVAPGTTLAISVEPKGGSPTGLPTGPVVFVGPLVRLISG